MVGVEHETALTTPETIINEFVTSISFHLQDNKDAYYAVNLISNEEYSHLLSLLGTTLVLNQLSAKEAQNISDHYHTQNYWGQIIDCARILGVSGKYAQDQINLASLFLSHLSQEHNESDQSTLMLRKRHHHQEFELMLKTGLDPKKIFTVASWFLNCR